jgi:hypothetical protein
MHEFVVFETYLSLGPTDIAGALGHSVTCNS